MRGSLNDNLPSFNSSVNHPFATVRCGLPNCPNDGGELQGGLTRSDYSELDDAKHL